MVDVAVVVAVIRLEICCCCKFVASDGIAGTFPAAEAD